MVRMGRVGEEGQVLELRNARDSGAASAIGLAAGRYFWKRGPLLLLATVKALFCHSESVPGVW